MRLELKVYAPPIQTLMASARLAKGIFSRSSPLIEMCWVKALLKTMLPASSRVLSFCAITVVDNNNAAHRMVSSRGEFFIFRAYRSQNRKNKGASQESALLLINF